MAMKRTPSKDFELPPIQPKQPRTTDPAPPTTSQTPPTTTPPQSAATSVTPVVTQVLKPAVPSTAKLTSIPSSSLLHISTTTASPLTQTAQVVSNTSIPARVVGLTTGVIPSSVPSSSHIPVASHFATTLPASVLSLHQAQHIPIAGLSSSITSLPRVGRIIPLPPEIAEIRGLKHPRISPGVSYTAGGDTSLLVQHGIGASGIMPSVIQSATPLIATSPIIPSSLPSVPPPPYGPISTANSAASANLEQTEIGCSSPSQFLHPPVSLQAAAALSTQGAVTTPTLSTKVSPSQKGSRQPICSVEQKTSKSSSKDLKTVRSKVLKHRRAKLAELKLKYEILHKEKFFLEGGGNMMEFVTWKKRPNILRDQYLKRNSLDAEISGAFEHIPSPKEIAKSTILSPTSSIVIKMETESPNKSEDGLTEGRRDVKLESTSQQKQKEVKSPKLKKPEIPVSKPEPPPTTTSAQAIDSSTMVQIPLATVSPVSAPQQSQPQQPSTTPKANTPSSPALRPLQFPTSSPRPSTRSHASFSSVYESSHEDIVMRARHEAEVMRAIADLRKEGLWSASRLPKVCEPPRKKVHWDFLLEEMQWLATDFANEKRWKINAAKKLSRSVLRYHQERNMQHARSEKDELLKLRKIASSIAKEVKHFWDSIQKIVEHKQQLLLEEKRKKAMDMHLEFIVDQTAKYSNWLVKGLTTNSATPSEPSLQSVASHNDDSEGFITPEEVTDDEATIDVEEKQEANPDYSSELKQLQEEGEMPLDQLLASLPPELLKEQGEGTSKSGVLTPPPEAREEDDKMETDEQTAADKTGETPSEVVEEEKKKTKETPKERRRSPRKRETRSSSAAARSSATTPAAASPTPAEPSTTNTDETIPSSSVATAITADADDCNDRDYLGGGDDEEMEDETTIAEQEAHEEEGDHSEEMDALEKEGELPLDELLKMYNLQRQSATPESEVDVEEEQQQQEDDGSAVVSGDESSSVESEGLEEEAAEDEGLEVLVSGKSLEEACQTEAGLSDVAAVAEQFQPKGITLATTEVKTKVPFLLKHKLREYQHIGLDWLVAMHERRLNGILADEMGLGKTMQTIALLAHMACDKGNWGPHLVIVPTSVMLNWEYELKKWCPAFKILTYFGSLKERKQKRVGWSKLNAFHVCITSYNIAVQDHRAFKQKKWKYLILDEAQNIKNFKSQRWQTLLNFNSQRRLLLTGTPLQNNLMELWSLMHFLMPTVFSSHSDFREWFSNPLSGMVEGSQEYNESIVRRLHQVLRPFLLRRLKMEVEKQMPKKYEHVVLCRLSKRQRFLYDEYMSRAKTKDSLASGNYLSVINILMQLRKVCNHPDLFEPRPIISPFTMRPLEFYTASLVFKALEIPPFEHVSLDYLNFHLADYELKTDAFAAFHGRQLQAPRALLLDPSLPQVTAGESEDRRRGFLEDLHLPGLTAKQQEWTLSRRRHLHEVNHKRCRRLPMYGCDLVQAVRKICHQEQQATSTRSAPLSQPSSRYWQWIGYSCCLQHQTINLPWSSSSPSLKAALPTIEQRAKQLDEVLKRFLITIPSVTVTPPTLHTYLPTPSTLTNDRVVEEHLVTELSPRASFLHPVATGNCFQFPETRLIQYDCGKLQTLDALLQRLKVSGHRVLIFTQMARMLDILEIFLNYHGHTYLRLDGATPPQKRQFLMDRFNRDDKIFCFILSTRSGGLGVNLTGADTVVFYDSDWNPTMDAQAQDRCHRIGQTRDVHIYRLVCDSTVEENILKKASQKRMLGNIAIEGGAFTTEFFKQASLRELFKVSQQDDHQSEVEASSLPHTSPLPPPPSTTTTVVSVEQRERNRGTSDTSQGSVEVSTEKQIEDLLMQAEDENDVQAATQAKAEQVAEMAEFDEQYSSQSGSNKEEKPSESESKAMSEFARIEVQLSAIERYAMKFLEEETADLAAEQLRIAEENIELAKKDWELSHLQSLREEEDRLAEEEDPDDVLLTYDRPEMTNKVFVEETSGEEMPLWLPPTPPADGEDEFYVDFVLDMSYDTQSVISPAVLASMAPFSEEDYDVFGLSRRNTENESRKAQKSVSKHSSKEHVNVPPSLFWRRFAADTLSTKLKKLATHQKKLKSKDQFTPLLEQQPEGPEWSCFEDWILLKGVTDVLEFPLSLTISVPAQMPNWPIVADLISSLSRVRRSALQCREHLMNVVIPREDHTTKGDELEPKKYKSRETSLKKTKRLRDQRTKNLVVNDNNKEQTTHFSTCFNWVAEASSKRKQSPKFTRESIQKPSTHGDLLKDYGIQLESVQSPMHIAQQRTERIQAELPRHSQVHQLLSQPYQHLSMVRGFHPGAQFVKSAPTDIAKAGYNIAARPPGGGAAVGSGAVSVTAAAAVAAQRFQAQPSTSVTTFTATQMPQSSSATTALSTTTIPVLPTPAAVSQIQPASTVVPNTTTLTSTIGKKFTATPSATVTDLGKTLMARGLTHQQLLLLRQHTQQLPGQTTQLPRAQIAQPQTIQTLPTQATVVQQKISLPSGIEQLRASVASVTSVALPLQQRFAGISTTSAGTVRGITAGGRTLQTEEVLALLKQQSLRMAASQSLKSAAASGGGTTQFPTTTATQIQFRQTESGGVQLTAKVQQQPLPQAVLQADGVKFVSGPSKSGTDNVQVKVEMVEQSPGASLSSSGAHTHTAAGDSVATTVHALSAQQAKLSAVSVNTAAAQNLVKAQLQQVLAAQQKAQQQKQQQLQAPKTSDK